MPVIYPPLPSSLFPLHHSPLNSRSLRELDDQSFDPEIVEVPRTPPIVSGIVLVGLGLRLDGLNDVSVESSPEPLPTIGTHIYSPFFENLINVGRILAGRHDLVSVDECVAVGEVALPPPSDFYLQVQKSLNFEPLGVQKTIELDASQLERQSALYNLEHSNEEICDLGVLDHLFSHSPPIKLQKNEIERQLLANLFKKKSRRHPKSQHVHNPPYSAPTQTTKVVGMEQPRSVKQSAVSDERSIFFKRSYQTLKKLGLERLAIFRLRSGRDDLDLTSPTITPQDDPRSPKSPTLERVFLAFNSLYPPSPSPIETQSSESVPQSGPHPKSEAPSNKNMEIGLGLPSRVAFRRTLQLQRTSSRDAIRSRSFSEEYPHPSVIVTEPSITPSYTSRVQSTESSNQFLKPSDFTQRPIYDVIEVPTPPSSTSSSSVRGTPSPQTHWSSPFVRLNVPQKKRSPRSQLSTPSLSSLVTVSSDAEVGTTTDVDSLPEVPVTPATSARPDFKRPGFQKNVLKFTRGLFKRSRSTKTNDLSSPVVVEHADTPPGCGLLRQDIDDGTSCCSKEKNLQYLF
jgi:hypothetical protein